jgi:hypothetical protein
MSADSTMANSIKKRKKERGEEATRDAGINPTDAAGMDSH